MKDMVRCGICGNFFKPLTGNTKYCRLCNKNISYYKPKLLVKKVCPICGESFETAYSNKKYCSIECAKKVIASKYKPDKQKVKIICGNCKKEFLTKDLRIKYCGRSCAKEAKKNYNKSWREQNEISKSVSK